MKKQNKSKTVAKTTVANNTSSLTPRQLKAVENKTTLGRPRGAVGNSLVSLAELVKALPESAQIPVSLRYLKATGLQIGGTPFVSNSASLKSVVESYKTTAGVQAIDLNESEKETAIA